MAFQTSRQASPLLSLSLWPRSLRFSPNWQILPSSQRYIHEEQQQQQYEQKQQFAEKRAPYERRPMRLPYTNPKRFQNARPQPRAPFEIRARRPFVVNDDPQALDEMYLKLFGKDMRLPSEVKWQAVTHKSFDHGRQPFNSKLRFLGKRLLQMQVSIHLLSAPFNKAAQAEKVAKPSVYRSLEGARYQNPEPFTHEAYGNIENVTGSRIEGAIKESRLMPLIRESGLPSVMRWKPADVTDLARSGQGLVALECLYAIVGALALQKGGDVAMQFIHDRIVEVKKVKVKKKVQEKVEEEMEKETREADAPPS